MHTVTMERRLAAIFSADVQGYSRLMSHDEEETIHTLTAYRDVMARLIQQYRGRVVDSAGDNILAEFASIVDAMQCAVAVQRTLSARNGELPAHRAMAFRIGINLGDVVVDGERIYGDGVNIAARLQNLADGGGICIAGTVYDQVESRLDLEYVDMGEQVVKNIAKPVRVYRVQMQPETTSLVVCARTRTDRQARLKTAPVVSALLMMLAAIVALWCGALRFAPYAAAVASARQRGGLPPDTPALAVLPFATLSRGSTQESLSKGITEDLITELFGLVGVFVIDRQAMASTNGESAQVQQVGQQLGVQYVLAGSVRKVDNRVRITAQLVDATTGQYLWANRYDRELHDIFALQDEVTQRIVTALREAMFRAPQGR
jgi:TolB-like protein/class 3 adenylate cyclase